MTAWFETVESSRFALEHAHQFAVDISVHVIAVLAATQRESQRHSIRRDDCAIFWFDYFDAGALGRQIFLFARRCRLRRLSFCGFLMDGINAWRQHGEQSAGAEDH